MRTWILALVCLPLALVAMGQDSCSTETTNEPDAEPAAGDEDRGETAGLGDSITLEGSETSMQVTVLRVLDPPPVGEFDEPLDDNTRFVGIELRMRNVGDATYDDAPSNGAALIMADGTEAGTTLVTGGPCSSGIGTATKISPGDARRGCIVFEAPAKGKPRTFQLTLDSGFGPEAGEWDLR